MRVRTGLLVLAIHLATAFSPEPARAQTFSKITDTSNPIVTQGNGPGGSFIGSSWIDVDGDRDLDLFIVRKGLFRNDGAGVFTALPNAVLSQGLATGCTWADVDNDGDPDLYVAGGAPSGSALYLNDGAGGFNKLASGTIADTLTHFGWAAAFADHDLDGVVDLVLAAPIGFNGVTGTSRLFRGLGGGQFARLDSAALAQNTSFDTVPTWADFDDDGDPDLFFGSGSGGGALGPDRLFVNRLESSAGWLQRTLAAPMATDLHDGQVYNFIDYDHDGDLDAYLTNFGGNANVLYRNQGAGVFAAVPAVEAGPIVSDIAPSLASVWQDFDNDADLDCYVTNAQTFAARYYRNDGGTFVVADQGLLTGSGPHWGATAGDYDHDGRLDLYVNGTTATHGLFRNTTVNSNHWLRLHLTGTASNRSAIGARVRVLSMVGGLPRWQQRVVSSQDSFDGMNAFDPHFGLADATQADSLVIDWPSGRQTRRAAVPADTVLDVTEPDATTGVLPPSEGAALAIHSAGPNPGRGPVDVEFSAAQGGRLQAELIDITGRLIERRSQVLAAAGRQRLQLGAAHTLPPGVYHVRLTLGTQRATARLVRLR